jgi:hypothetical protein
MFKKVLSEKHMGFGKPGHKWKVIIKMDLREMGCEGADRTGLQTFGNFLTS